MGDLPQYFKFVRWILTSSLKENKFEKKIMMLQKLLIIFSPLFRTHERDTVTIIHLCKFTSCLETNFVFKVCRRPPLYQLKG